MSKKSGRDSKEGEKRVIVRRAPRKPYCHACKDRRVVCDMLQPSCRRCLRNGRYMSHPSLVANTTPAPPDSHKTNSDVWARQRPLTFEQSSVFKFSSLVYTPDDRQLYIDLLQSSTQSVSGDEGPSTFTKAERELEGLVNLPIDTFLSLFDIQPDDFSFALNKHLQNLYLEAFLEQIRTPATFLMYGDTWADLLRGSADLTMLLAARACGAIHVGHPKSAKILYDSCLDRLKHIPPDLVVVDSLAYLKVCAAILIMFSWEMNVPGMNRDRFLIHFNGVAEMLKQYVPSHGATVAESGNTASIENVLLKLLLQEYRTCECVATGTLRIPPPISLQLYDNLQKQSNIFNTIEKDNAVLYHVCHVAASAFDAPIAAKVEALDKIAIVLRDATWYNEVLTEAIILPDKEYSTSEPRPFRTGLCLIRANSVETWKINALNMYCEAVILRLQMTMIGEVKQAGHETLAKADTIIRMAWFLLNFEIRANLPWTSLVLMIAYEAYALISGPNDVCRDWTRRLCLQVVQQVGVGMASIFTQELIRIDRQRLIL